MFGQARRLAPWLFLRIGSSAAPCREGKQDGAGQSPLGRSPNLEMTKNVGVKGKMCSIWQANDVYILMRRRPTIKVLDCTFLHAAGALREHFNLTGSNDRSQHGPLKELLS